jgi:hypothetical protein
VEIDNSLKSCGCSIVILFFLFFVKLAGFVFQITSFFELIENKNNTFIVIFAIPPILTNLLKPYPYIDLELFISSFNLSLPFLILESNIYNWSKFVSAILVASLIVVFVIWYIVLNYGRSREFAR